MANVICNVFKEHLLKGNHNFSASGGSTYKLALYTSSKTVSASAVTGYNTTNEAANAAGSGYTAAGNTLTNTGVTGSSSNATAFCDFTDSAVCVLDFGGDFTTSAGTFTIQFPANDASNAVIRISG